MLLLLIHIVNTIDIPLDLEQNSHEIGIVSNIEKNIILDLFWRFLSQIYCCLILTYLMCTRMKN